MFDFISKHAKLIVVSAVLVIIVLSVILVIVSRQSPTVVPNEEGVPAANGLIIDSSNQYLSNEELSNEDKYLMLLGQTMTEQYGTYKLGDVRTLWDVQNHATEVFSSSIQKIIDSNDRSKHVITTVDPDSIKLSKISNTKATVLMNATTEDKNISQLKNITSTVSLIQQGSYWLVENIIFTDR